MVGAVLACAAPGAARAAFEDLGSGARATGMGNAFTAVADDLHAYFYNPAGLGALLRSQVSAGYSRPYLGLGADSELSVSHVAAAVPLRGARWGTLAVAFNQLSLTGLYDERTLSASYGRKVWEGSDGDALFGGGTAKLLTLGFTPAPEASNALNLLASTGRADPVLSGNRSRTAPDLDGALLLRLRHRWNLGLAVKHLNEPNIALAGDDPVSLRRALRVGLAYKALWMNLAGEMQVDGDPGGGYDKRFLLGAERYFPTLKMGQFGLRGGFGMGTRDFRQISAGLSYRINKIQFDYGFAIPLASVKGTSGLHQFGVTLHFGAPTPEEEYAGALARKIERAAAPRPGFAYEFENLPSPLPEILEEQNLPDVASELAAGRYESAYQALAVHLRRASGEIALVSLGRRLETVKGFFPQLDRTQGPWAEALFAGIEDFLHGRDRQGLLKVSYAVSLNPLPPALEGLLSALEGVTRLKADRLPPGSPSLLQAKLEEAQTLFTAGKLDGAAALCQDVLVLAPGNPTALARLGSVYYVQEKLELAAARWREALKVETRPRERENLEFMLKQVEAKLAKPASPVMGDTTKPASPAQAPRRPPRRADVDPQAIERLYQYGVELYSKGRFQEAAAAFRKILELEPGNEPSAKALRRLEGEMMLRERER